MVTRTASYHRSLGLSQAMCTSDFVFTAVACNTLGNTNYRQVWVSARFDKAVAALPDPCYALGDAAHGPSDNMLVPYVGSNLTPSRGTFTKTAAAIRAVVRLRNFLRRRRADTLVGGVEMNGPTRDENVMLSNDAFGTPPSGRPPTTQSFLRESLCREIALRTLVRPIHNVERNRSQRNVPGTEDHEA